ncbi:serine hydrolase domain-containing protein [Rubrobacter radiotolerans]|uniref:Serine hydrolase domain-containing protein n=1 Tax=Rubrobacter radiotolerans TaxID=42256 RepID=A0AB35T5Z0_RUBRA|nr:serine hydrolase domain-containing protein [Rubrobacter radiotolerans]MDX5894372.1 serine hydrolase domain-containing protein [Rubrobacter radiotolerans]
MREAADRVLAGVAQRENGVPGVVAMATDREANVYEGAAGVREVGGDEPMTTDAVFAIFSCTKAITGVAVMQLVEEDVLTLDTPAKEYAPEIAEIQVLEGFDEDGEPRTRAPKSDVTVGQLMLHTAGFGYDFFNEDLLRYGEKRGVPSVVTAKQDSLNSVLLFDPGERWEYGSNIDWVGKVVEGARGKRLGEVFRERVFEPLGMESAGFTMTDEMRARRATMHQRGEDGTLVPMPDFELPQDPEQHMGGHGLYMPVGDYMKFIRMVLNDGAGENGRVLGEETARKMGENGLGELKIKGLPGVIPQLSNDAEFFPGMPKSWGYTFMINDEDAPTGRPAGELGWAGLANLFYWIDRKNGLGGFWATQIFPFADPVSFSGYLDFESAVYSSVVPETV